MGGSVEEIGQMYLLSRAVAGDVKDGSTATRRCSSTARVISFIHPNIMLLALLCFLNCRPLLQQTAQHDDVNACLVALIITFILLALPLIYCHNGGFRGEQQRNRL